MNEHLHECSSSLRRVQTSSLGLVANRPASGRCLAGPHLPNSRTVSIQTRSQSSLKGDNTITARCGDAKKVQGKAFRTSTAETIGFCL